MIDDSSFDIQIVTEPDDLEACLALRYDVFVTEQDVPLDEEVDGDDPNCAHVLVRDAGTPIGAARFKYANGAGKIRRVCVPHAARGRGIGAHIIQFIVAQMRAQPDCKVAKLGAQTHAIAFYERLGFEISSEEYLDANIPHKDMELDLTTS